MKDSIKSDSYLSNEEIRQALSSNDLVANKNPLIFTNLMTTSEPIDRSVEKFIPMLEFVKFDQLVIVADFLTRELQKDEYVTPESVFESSFPNETFWKSLKVGECLMKTGAINRTLLKDRLVYQARNIFYRSRVRYDDKSMSFLYSDDKVNSQTKMLNGVARLDFINFLYELLHDYLGLTEVKALVNELMTFVTRDITTNNVIQLLDYYIVDGVAKEGFYDGSARFTILRPAKECLTKGKVTKRYKEVDELIAHLCDHDPASIKRCIALMSTIFLNSQEYKSYLYPSIRIFGAKGANGKSLFADILTKAFNVSNVTSTQISKLDDQHTLEKTLQSLVAIDQDSSSSKISSNSAAMFKSVVTGDRLESRQIYGQMRDILPVCLLIIFSNNLPKTSDKSDAFNRRLNIFKCSHRLLESKVLKVDEKWFQRIRSEGAAQYLFEMLLLESRKYVDGKHPFPEKSEIMLELLDDYRLENDSATMFVEDVGLESIVGMQVKEVKETYEEWCETNDMTALKRQFNDSLMEKFGLEAKTVRISSINPSSKYYAVVKSGSKQSVRCWRFKDDEKNKEFFEKLNTL